MTVCTSKFSAAALLLLAALASPLSAETSQQPSREAAATLVVFNNRDPDARALADYYAQRRFIPLEQVIGLDCPTEE
jgi:hypothetical protein